MTGATATTATPDQITAHWAARLHELAARHHVIGASLGILHRGRLIAEAATGTANLDAGTEATTDTLFQIGSISKVWTATVAMALVDEGLLELDTPIVSFLPEFRTADQQLTDGVTLRHLLTHTSGIDGDFFADTGRGDDCLEKYTALLADVPATHPLGATLSYCNTGFTLLGRVLEYVTGVPWDELMRERLYRPLGLTHTATLPEEVLSFRAAIGHFGNPPAPAKVWGLMRSVGPAGLICSVPREVLAFAQLHMNGGLTDDGTKVVSAGSVAAMQTPQAKVPDPDTLGHSWGLGWFLDDWNGHRVYGHDGATLGQSAFLRVLPDADLAICLLTNGGDTRSLFGDLFREIAQEVGGVTMRTPIEPADEPVPFDPADHVGVYERLGVRIEISERDGGLVMRSTSTGPLASLLPEAATELPLHPVRPGVFAVRQPGMETWFPVVFYTLADGTPYLHHGARATPKVG
ncbi:serine hydrolase domain-containing protein [Streptacidiphilus jiangxiensis]|uniref:CubicO group peptidase, beta-lactamase class C family n=1 Tax=Streptacidiphilus jiangxiensis TaxID=235985 RepID=A0A1H7X8A7_STRJI|nr:serine hydrolase domain-containing protein [Streptacidiphilus jiangxiensis]SEM29903.1 CubicO group peptidase, beta-lactamase class C family [Streptacidiphilus jiangxiensis]